MTPDEVREHVAKGLREEYDRLFRAAGSFDSLKVRRRCG